VKGDDPPGRQFTFMAKATHRAVVLVVEDVAWIRAGMVRRLKECGYVVTEAADAAEALVQAELLLPAAVLTEEELPTYAELVGRIARHPALARVPVVIVNPDAEAGSRLGDTVLLPRYCDLETLLVRTN
jgi:CheY-like chemotaxis protein